VPGVTDYWIHDVRGCPVASVAAFQQGSLVEFLPRCAKMIRAALGEDPEVLVVFDRGGAFPTAMLELQALPEGEVDFLTYERAPYVRHGREYFERHGRALWRRERDGEKQRLLVVDGGKYLGDGRGRVRRISVLLPDNEQINVLTSSQQNARWLVSVLFARWCQENAFKYGAERWGFDQLDGRQVEPYPKGTLIPNPYRRSLKESRDDAIEREGKLRCKLARLKRDDPEGAGIKATLDETVEMLWMVKDALRRAPDRIAIEKTHLRGKLVHHTREYKLLVDTIRVASMNAEEQLARLLRPHLRLKAEAKRVLQNLFQSSGSIHAGRSAITVRLDPTANRAELRAIGQLLNQVNRRRLIHPGDRERRPLRFVLQRTSSPQGA
jgi:hypothetical protein